MTDFSRVATVFYGDDHPQSATLGRSVNLGRSPMPPQNFGPPPGVAAEAALRQYNVIRWVYEAFTHSQPDATPVPGYDPVPLVAGTHYEPYASQFMGDVNPAQTKARMAKIDTQLEDQRILAASGWTGTIDVVGAVLANPLWLLVLWVCLRLWNRHPHVSRPGTRLFPQRPIKGGREFGKGSFRLLIFAIVSFRKVWRSAALNLQNAHGRIRQAVQDAEKNEKR
jgi:hypothetical protein